MCLNDIPHPGSDFCRRLRLAVSFQCMNTLKPIQISSPCICSSNYCSLAHQSCHLPWPSTATHNPPRDHWNQYIEKCSVHTRRCLASHSPSAPWSFVVLAPSALQAYHFPMFTFRRYFHSPSCFWHFQNTSTCVVSSLLVCLFLGTFAIFTTLLLPTSLSQPSSSSIQSSDAIALLSWRWLISFYTWPLPLSSFCHVWLPLWHPVLDVLWPLKLHQMKPHTSFFPHIQFHFSISNTISTNLSPKLTVLVLYTSPPFSIFHPN